MRRFKYVLAALPFCVLAGCGNDALDGTYEAETTVMGFSAGKQTVEFSSDYIVSAGNKIKSGSARTMWSWPVMPTALR